MAASGRDNDCLYVDNYYVTEHNNQLDVIIITLILWEVLLYPDIINSIKFRRAIIPLLQQLELPSTIAAALIRPLRPSITVNFADSTIHNLCASHHRVDPSIIARIALHQSDHGESEESTHLQHHSSRRNLLFNSGASVFSPLQVRSNPSSPPHGEKTTEESIFRQADNLDMSSNMSSLQQLNIADILSRPIPDHRSSELYLHFVSPRYVSPSSANPQQVLLQVQDRNTFHRYIVAHSTSLASIVIPMMSLFKSIRQLTKEYMSITTYHTSKISTLMSPITTLISFQRYFKNVRSLTKWGATMGRNCISSLAKWSYFVLTSISWGVLQENS